MSINTLNIILIIISAIFVLTFIFLTYYVSQYVKGSKNYINWKKIKNERFNNKFKQDTNQHDMYGKKIEDNHGKGNNNKK